jgi:SanA protein
MQFLKRVLFRFHSRFFRRLFRFLFWFGLCMILFVFFADWRIRDRSSDFIYNDCDSIPYNKVGVLLGTSKKLAGGRTNLYFQYRIEAAVELFTAGKIDYVLVSGDNGSKYYNEPLDMKKALISHGIPSERIILDYAGFRTFDSMVRAKEVFGQQSFTVISQKFHVERAVYIGTRMNYDVVGYAAKDVSKYYGLKTRFREKLARVKVYIDFLSGATPKFLGDTIHIPDVPSGSIINE